MLCKISRFVLSCCTLCSVFIVLKSEVEDLKILLKSADKDVETLKRSRNNDAIESGRRYAALESKVRSIFLFPFSIVVRLPGHISVQSIFSIFLLPLLIVLTLLNLGMYAWVCPGDVFAGVPGHRLL